MIYPLYRFLTLYIGRLVWALLWPLAAVLPVELALFHGLHGYHPWSARRVHRIDRGWYSLEWGSWTLEVSTSDRIDAWLMKAVGRTA